MIGIIIALQEEAHNIKTQLSECFVKQINQNKVFIFKVLNETAVLTFCGVGKVNAAAATMNLIANFKLSTIINIGTAGSTNENVKVGSLILAEKIYNFDVDVTTFGYEKNQIPHEPVFYEVDPDLFKITLELLKAYNCKIHLGNVASGESFINVSNYSKFEILLKSDTVAVDMESVAIAQVCAANNVNFIVVKIISDSIFSVEPSTEQYNKNLKNMRVLICKIVLDLLHQLTFMSQSKKVL